MQPRELANSICDTLQNAGFQAFLVGGCVRDLLLEREPADYDVATSATPEQVLELFSGRSDSWRAIRSDFSGARRREG